MPIKTMFRGKFQSHLRVVAFAMALAGSSQLNAGGDESHVVRLSGADREITLDMERLQTRAGELMAPVTFNNGSKALLTSSVVVSSGDPEFVKSSTAVRSVRRLLFTDAYVVEVESPLAALRLSQELSARKSVRYAHPDFIFPIEARGIDVSDPYFSSQWNLKNTGQNGATPGVDIGVESAWTITRGSPETIVAVLDLGFDQNHKDMIDAWFVNPEEVPGNKKDDDGNGLVDDVRGWNFSINGSNLIYGAAPNHGTATSGIIGARSNDHGIIGICPGCKILPVVVSGRVSEDASAIGYAAAMGAAVLSNSWGYRLESPKTDVVTEALTSVARRGRGGKGTPVLFAMRNAATDDCRASAPDISAHPDVIAVSSIDFNDIKVQNSGFGKCLQFLGPSSGSNINGVPATDRSGAAGYNTDGSGNFEDLDFHNAFWGTSAATPQVAGLFALLLSREPGLTRDEALSRMRRSAIKANPAEAAYDPVTGHSLKYGYGRASAINLFN